MFALCLGLSSPVSAQTPFLLELTVPPELSISSSIGTFTLQFPDFIKGSQSSTEVLTYRIRANNLSRGRLIGAISARLSEPFEYVQLEASVMDFSSQGNENFSHLQSNQAGFQKVTSEMTALADKEPGRGQWDSCLDGQIGIAWRATLLRDAPAGQESRQLLVTIKDAD